MAVRIPERVLGRVFDRVSEARPFDCWEFQGCITSTTGYGFIGWSGYGEKRNGTTAHRAAFTAAFGPIPGDLVVDHMCHNRVCCNPFHLRLLDMVTNSRLNAMARRTHCPSGHPYDYANTRRYTFADGRTERRCAACAKEQGTAHYHRKKASI